MRRHFRDTPALTLALAALAYPAAQVLRLTPNGAEAATRPLDLIFVAVAFSLSLGIVRVWPTYRPTPARGVLVIATLVLLFIGGVIAGSGPMWERLPGPYLPAADERSIDPLGIAAATWTAADLGTNQRFAADRTNQWLLGTYGAQDIVSVGSSGVDLSRCSSHHIWASGARLLARSQVQYLLVERG